MTAPQALFRFWNGNVALVLGPNTIVWVVDPIEKLFVVEQHGQVISAGRLSPAQAKRFTGAASGAREIRRSVINLNSLVPSATA